MRLTTLVLGATLALSMATTTAAVAKPHLRDTPIDDGLLALGLADEIRSLKKRGKAYLAANGVVVGQPETYCALGRNEIEKSSQIGSLLRVN